MRGALQYSGGSCGMERSMQLVLLWGRRRGGSGEGCKREEVREIEKERHVKKEKQLIILNHKLQ